MKKITISILIFFIILTGCTNKDQHQIQDTGDIKKENVSSANTEVKIPQKIDEINSEFELIETQTDINTNTENNIYQDEQGTQYIYGKEDGQFKGYYKSNGVASEIESKSENQLQNIAEKFLEQYIKLEQYTFTEHSYSEDTKIHTYNYYRIINGYKTADFVFVMLNASGEVVGYAAPYRNIFDDISVPKIDEIQLIEKLEKSMKVKYQYSEYEIKDKIIILDEQRQLRMLYSVEFIIENYKLGDTFDVPIESQIS